MSEPTPVRLDQARSTGVKEPPENEAPGEAPPAPDIPVREEPEVKRSPEVDMAAIQKEIDEAQKKADDAFMEKYQDIELSELLASGYVRHTIEIAEGLKVVLRTLTEDDDLDISKKMEDSPGTQHYVSEMVSRHTLAKSIVAMNDRPFANDEEEAFEKIGKMAKVVKLAIYEEFQGLGRAVTMLIKGKSGNSLERRLIGPASI